MRTLSVLSSSRGCGSSSKQTEEVVVASVEASSNDAFVRLGLTDSALLQAVTKETPLVTVDLDLYLAASEKEAEAVVNFTHLRRL